MNEEDYKDKLTAEEFRVLRGGGTEPAFSGRPIHAGSDGKYNCKACGAPLFDEKAKFESGTGWPSFDDCFPGAVVEKVDNSYGMKRIEISCAQCGSHLGHVFDDGPTSTGKRYCTNSVCFKQQYLYV